MNGGISLKLLRRFHPSVVGIILGIVFLLQALLTRRKQVVE